VEKSIQILLIDDDEDMFLIVRSLLQRSTRMQFDLEWVDTFDKALAAIGGDAHDVVLLDYRLGARDGLELLQQDTVQASSVPIIVLTGQSGGDIDTLALRAGAADFINKTDLTEPNLSRAIHYALERRQYAEELQASETRFQGLNDVLPQLVWTTLPDGSCDYVNKRWTEVTGQLADEAAGFGWLKLLHAEDADEVFDLWMEAVKGEESPQAEYRIWNAAENAYHWYLMKATPVRDARGSVTRWVGTCTDIDEKRRMTEELRVSRERLDFAVAPGAASCPPCCRTMSTCPVG